jgi:hypothetical protein
MQFKHYLIVHKKLSNLKKNEYYKKKVQLHPNSSSDLKNGTESGFEIYTHLVNRKSDSLI